MGFPIHHSNSFLKNSCTCLFVVASSAPVAHSDECNTPAIHNFLNPSSVGFPGRPWFLASTSNRALDEDATSRIFLGTTQHLACSVAKEACLRLTSGRISRMRVFIHGLPTWVIVCRSARQICGEVPRRRRLQRVQQFHRLIHASSRRAMDHATPANFHVDA